MAKGISLTEDKAKMMRDLGQKWRDRPDLFVEDVFGAKCIPWQAEAMKALNNNNKIAVRSGHGVGKSTTLAWTILWWLVTRAPAKVACTAPSGHQLEDVLWAEVVTWHSRMLAELRDMIEITKDRIHVKGRERDCFAVARTSRIEKPEAFQGFHSPHMLFIVDEASGVPDIIYEVGQGAMSTEGAKTIMVGNPNRNSGYFYEAFHRNKALWYTMRVSCTDSPLASMDYVNEVIAQYGEDSNVYRIRVLGEFPKSDDDTVMSLDRVEQSVNRDIEPSGPIFWGLDVARFGGDRTGLAKRQGPVLLEPIRVTQNKDLMQTAGWLYAEYNNTPKHLKPDQILIDSIGLGSGVLDRAKEMGLPVKGVNVSHVADAQDKYVRKRDELWFKAKEWFDDMHASMPEDKELIGELVSVRYKYSSNGKIEVESKDSMKQRGMRSPDIADAFCLTFAGKKLNRDNINKRPRMATMEYSIFGD